MTNKTLAKIISIVTIIILVAFIIFCYFVYFNRIVNIKTETPLRKMTIYSLDFSFHVVPPQSFIEEVAVSTTLILVPYIYIKSNLNSVFGDIVGISITIILIFLILRVIYIILNKLIYFVLKKFRNDK